MLSIVTIHLNDFDGLAKTYASIQSMGAENSIEWIVVDGGSEVNTQSERTLVDEIRARSDAFVSEPDEGIYHAMNKGVGRGIAPYLLFLNAGDELHADFDAAELELVLEQNQFPDLLLADCLECGESGEQLLIRARSPGWAWYGMPAYHPAVFFRRESLPDGPYDQSLKIAADYDLICRMISSGARSVRWPVTVSRFYLGGVSDHAHSQTLAEEAAVRQRHFPFRSILNVPLVWMKKALKMVGRRRAIRRLWRR